MDPTQIRFGIMGCAQISKKLTRAITLSPNSTLYAIASRSLPKATKFAASFDFLDPKKLKIYGTYMELLNDPFVDAVYMPIPTSFHVKWATIAALNKKHLLLEKPVALNSDQLDLILKACEENGVQFMDGTMWVHHPRTRMMREIVCDSRRFGPLRSIRCTSTFLANEEFFKSNIRVNPDCDSLGALGDLGWYCITAILWATNYELPTFVVALPEPTINSNGIVLGCGASFHWDQENQKNALFYCSFLSNMSMDFAVYGANGSLHVNDLAIPCKEDSASFLVTSGAKFVELHIGWNVRPEEVQVAAELPQEALMVQEFARLVGEIKSSQCQPEKTWAEISRKNQLALDAVKKSIELGSKPVYL